MARPKIRTEEDKRRYHTEWLKQNEAKVKQYDETRAQKKKLLRKTDPEWRERERARDRKWLANHPDFDRERHLNKSPSGIAKREQADLYRTSPRLARQWYRAKVWGFEWEKFKEVLTRIEDGPCDICGAHTKMEIDHCHARMRFRGLLCGSCNRTLGLFNDDPSRFRAAAEYLEKNN